VLGLVPTLTNMGITKKERTNKEGIAFELFVEGLSVKEIAKEMNVNKNTIYNWITLFDWNVRKQNIQTKVREKQAESIADMKNRQISVVQAIIKKGLQDIIEGKTRITANEIVKAMYMELELRESKAEEVDLGQFAVTKVIANTFVNLAEKDGISSVKLLTAFKEKFKEKLTEQEQNELRNIEKQIYADNLFVAENKAKLFTEEKLKTKIKPEDEEEIEEPEEIEEDAIYL
jgi:transposase